MDIQARPLPPDPLSAQLWQYDGRPALTSLMRAEETWYAREHSAFWDDWIAHVFDASGASEFGVEVWCKILGIWLFTAVPAPDPAPPSWAFGDLRENFEHAGFGQNAQEIFTLPPEIRRLLLTLKYKALTSAFDIFSLNEAISKALSSFGRAYVLDGLDMSITLVLRFVPPPELVTALSYIDVAASPPTGVKLNVRINPQPAWGFGLINTNFEHGGFAPPLGA